MSISSSAYAADIILLPRARPQIEFVGETPSAAEVKPQNVIQLADPNGSIFGRAGIPSSLKGAVEAMQIALPRDYLIAMLARYGLVDEKKSSAITRTDLRSVDLSQFLYDRWAYAHPRSKLAKEFRCLVSFEGDISAFELLVASSARQKFADEGIAFEPISREAGVTFYAAVQSAYVASRACQRLVKYGWSPGKNVVE